MGKWYRLADVRKMNELTSKELTDLKRGLMDLWRSVDRAITASKMAEAYAEQRFMIHNGSGEMIRSWRRELFEHSDAVRAVTHEVLRLLEPDRKENESVPEPPTKDQIEMVGRLLDEHTRCGIQDLDVFWG